MDGVEQLHYVLHKLDDHMTVDGRQFMVFNAETVPRECHWWLTGVAALAAAKILGVTLDRFARWMVSAEAIFFGQRGINNQKRTPSAVFHAFMVQARKANLDLVLKFATEDEEHVKQMMLAEKELLGPDRGNCAVAECVRWMVLKRPRPQ